MELKEIQIRNFRSIKEEKIFFNHNCLVLIGKNEAGKSNVLKAIAAVFGKYIVTDRDKRKKIDNEKIESKDYTIRAIINILPDEIDEIVERLKIKFNGIEDISVGSKVSLKDFVSKVFPSFVIKIDVKTGGKPQFLYWTYGKKDIDTEFSFFLPDNKIDGAIGQEFKLITEVFKIIKDFYLENPIKCHYWQYSESFLLPTSVDINSFTSSPSEFESLQNIFLLCGRENILNEFESALSEDGDYSNLLEQVSKQVTTTFRKIWNDFKGTSIQLIPNGDEILIKIADKAKYNCEDRSDGFKKFISILLMLSTQSRANKILENDLILIDEPDQSLYPTSAQFLRDELLRIAKKSKVIYSTHSQFMIDTDNIDRHIIVEKENDVTVLNKENAKSPYTTDELLRRAIGASIFECLKAKNIVFEGYLDRQLFVKYIEFHKLQKEYKEFGQIFLGGISGVESVISILDSANKKFVIVADSDDASKNKRIEFQKNYPNYRENWLAYADVVKSISTMEDFIKLDLIENELKMINSEFSYESSKSAISNIEKGVNKDKEKKQEIKNKLILDLKKESIQNEYSQFIEKLKGKLNEL